MECTKAISRCGFWHSVWQRAETALRANPRLGKNGAKNLPKCSTRHLPLSSVQSWTAFMQYTPIAGRQFVGCHNLEGMGEEQVEELWAKLGGDEGRE